MKKLLLFYSCVFALSFLFSCGNDDESVTIETTVEEDKANVQQSFDDMVSCVKEIRDSRSFSELFNNFLNMSDGEMMNEEWVNNITEGLESVFDFDHVENNNRFDMSHHAGMHIYNTSNNSWTKTTEFNDKVVFKFPSEPSASSNNVELVLDAFTDQLVTIDGENISMPKTMHAYMNVDGTKAFEFTLSKVTYADNAGYEMPVEFDASLFMDPMTLDVELSRMSNTSYDMGMSMKNSGFCDMSIRSQFELKDDDFENLDGDSFEKAAVQVNLGQLSFRTMGDLASLFAIEEPTDAQVNSLADLDLFFNDFKIADLQINEELETILLFYKDDSSENTDDLLNELEELLEDIFG